jgi:hypothetical protein
VNKNQGKNKIFSPDRKTNARVASIQALMKEYKWAFSLKKQSEDVSDNIEYQQQLKVYRR